MVGVQPVDRIQMGMTVQHEFRATDTESGGKATNAEHAFMGGSGAPDRRMMDHHNAEKALFTGFFKSSAVARACRLPK